VHGQDAHATALDFPSNEPYSGIIIGESGSPCLKR